MQRPDEPTDAQSDRPPNRTWSTTRIVLAVVVPVVAAGALHLVGVLPPGG